MSVIMLVSYCSVYIESEVFSDSFSFLFDHRTTWSSLYIYVYIYTHTYIYEIN